MGLKDMAKATQAMGSVKEIAQYMQDFQYNQCVQIEILNEIKSELKKLNESTPVKNENKTHPAR